MSASISLRAQRLDQRRSTTKNDIPGILQATAFGLRATFHSTLLATPGQMTFGRDIIINATYLANWKFVTHKRQQRMLADNAKENHFRLNHTYKIGDKVYVTNNDVKRKLALKDGPFVVTQINTNGTVAIQRSPTVVETINIRRLHPVF